jgi:hypothetical protein
MDFRKKTTEQKLVSARNHGRKEGKGCVPYRPNEKRRREEEEKKRRK